MSTSTKKLKADLAKYEALSTKGAEGYRARKVLANEILTEHLELLKTMANPITLSPMFLNIISGSVGSTGPGSGGGGAPKATDPNSPWAGGGYSFPVGGGGGGPTGSDVGSAAQGNLDFDVTGLQKPMSAVVAEQLRQLRVGQIK